MADCAQPRRRRPIEALVSITAYRSAVRQCGAVRRAGRETLGSGEANTKAIAIACGLRPAQRSNAPVLPVSQPRTESRRGRLLSPALDAALSPTPPRAPLENHQLSHTAAPLRTPLYALYRAERKQQARGATGRWARRRPRVTGAHRGPTRGREDGTEDRHWWEVGRRRCEGSWPCLPRPSPLPSSQLWLMYGPQQCWHPGTKGTSEKRRRRAEERCCCGARSTTRHSTRSETAMAVLRYHRCLPCACVAVQQ